MNRILCCGCGACQVSCPKGAISMKPDGEGFLYPFVDESQCVNCGLCEKACPALNPAEPHEPMAVYAARANDEGVRLASSSGGVFTILARQVLADGGKVFGAAFDKTDWSVCHKGVADESGLEELRGSKYVQSRTAGIYREVKIALEANRPVLFSGTPCQIAALRLYLETSIPRSTLSTLTSNLTLVDVVCHAVPSPLAWQKFLRCREAALAQGRGSARAEGPNIRRISFRQKNSGWRRYSLSLRFANDKEYLADLKTDTFLKGFLVELYNRPSCQKCPAKGGRSGADLTLGDYWGVKRYHRHLDDDKGTSAVLVNTSAGAAALERIKGELELVPSKLKFIRKTNPAFFSPVMLKPKQQLKRAEFFAKCGTEDFDALVARLTFRPLWRRGLGLIKRMVLWLPRRVLG